MVLLVLIGLLGAATIYLSVNQKFLVQIALLEGRGPAAVVARGRRLIDPHWPLMLLLSVVEALLLLLGILACFVGLFVAWPVVVCITTAAYRQLLGEEGVAQAQPVGSGPAEHQEARHTEQCQQELSQAAHQHPGHHRQAHQQGAAQALQTKGAQGGRCGDHFADGRPQQRAQQGSQHGPADGQGRQQSEQTHHKADSRPDIGPAGGLHPGGSQHHAQGVGSPAQQQDQGRQGQGRPARRPAHRPHPQQSPKGQERQTRHQGQQGARNGQCLGEQRRPPEQIDAGNPCQEAWSGCIRGHGW